MSGSSLLSLTLIGKMLSKCILEIYKYFQNALYAKQMICDVFWHIQLYLLLARLHSVGEID